MAKKQKAPPPVKLERHPHRAAMERLQRAYQLLIEANQSTQIIKVEQDDDNTSQEVSS